MGLGLSLAAVPELSVSIPLGSKISFIRVWFALSILPIQTKDKRGVLKSYFEILFPLFPPVSRRTRQKEAKLAH